MSQRLSETGSEKQLTILEPSVLALMSIFFSILIIVMIPISTVVSLTTALRLHSSCNCFFVA